MIKKFVLFVILIFMSLFSFFSYAEDALDQAYNTSKSENHQIITNKFESNKVSNWVQSTAELMLKISIMIGLAVFLYGGIRFFLSMGDDSKAKKVRDSLITAGIGLIVAFGAWAILQLIISIGATLST